MSEDIVNAFFKPFYPPKPYQWDDFSYGSVGLEWQHRGKPSTIFPAMKCADGFEMSVQGHYGAYSHPRDDFADRYSSVEIMCKADPLLDEHGGHECADEMIYGYVPVELVEKVIASHGGLIAQPASPSPSHPATGE